MQQFTAKPWSTRVHARARTARRFVWIEDVVVLPHVKKVLRKAQILLSVGLLPERARHLQPTDGLQLTACQKDLTRAQHSPTAAQTDTWNPKPLTRRSVLLQAVSDWCVCVKPCLSLRAAPKKCGSAHPNPLHKVLHSGETKFEGDLTPCDSQQRCVQHNTDFAINGLIVVDE
jgi:hypothetical protein